MTQEHNGAASGVTNEGSVLVCVNYSDQYLTAELDLQAAELFAKTLLLAIDAAKQMGKKE